MKLLFTWLIALCIVAAAFADEGNGPYLITVGRATYACNYRGQCFSWGHENFLSAIEACANHEAKRPRLERHFHNS
jgi:hypothetical protein